MRFERTKGSLMNLASGEISADALLDMLVRVTQDVYEANYVTRASALHVADQKSLLMNLHNLSTTLLTIFQSNPDAVNQFPSFIQSKIRGSMAELSEKEGILSGIMEEIRQEETNQKKLRELQQEIEKSRGHLLSVKEACIAIQQRIDELNDVHLDDMAEEKKKLETELNVRESKAQTLTEQKTQLREALDQTQNRINAVQEQVSAAQRDLTERETTERQMQMQLEEMASRMKEIAVNLEQMQIQMQEIPERNTRMMEEYQEVKAKLTMIRNAINSARNDILLPGNLFNANKNGGSLSVQEITDLAIAQQKFEDWNEMIQWFAVVDQRVNDLLEVYRCTMAEMVKQAETLTSQKN